MTILRNMLAEIGSHIDAAAQVAGSGEENTSIRQQDVDAVYKVVGKVQRLRKIIDLYSQVNDVVN